MPAHIARRALRRRRRAASARRAAVDDGHLLLPDEVLPAGTVGKQAQIPEMTGGDLVLSGTRAGLRADTARRSCSSSSRTTAPTSSRRSRARRPTAASSASRRPAARATTSNYAQHFAIVLDGQLESTPYIDFKRRTPTASPARTPRSTSAAAARSRRRRTSRSSSRRVRCPYSFKQIERTDVSATLGKSSLTQAWHAALVGLRRRRALPARPLPLPRPRRGDRPRHLRALLLRGDPALPA